ncbi:MAG: DUF456 domain-containing protein [Patescibacteria group bacterium]|nr:DUF456 domain-containing protein [Patescibacteria group bacterium]MDE2116602.1 DUF456 domain-containing protein [Patescibacteria group bacterium]
MSHPLAFTIALIFLIPGVLLAFVPFLPALGYMFIVALIFAAATGFTALSVKGLALLLAIVVVSIVMDHIAGIVGARYGGARVESLLWGFVGTVIGTIVEPAFGSFAGLFLGVLLSELYYRSRHRVAIRAASGALVGRTLALGINLALAVIFFVSFIILVLA